VEEVVQQTLAEVFAARLLLVGVELGRLEEAAASLASGA